MPFTSEMTETWGEWGNIFYRLAIFGEGKALEPLHYELALAFSFAEAFKAIQPLLPDELSDQAEAILRAEMEKQGFFCPTQEPKYF